MFITAAMDLVECPLSISITSCRSRLVKTSDAKCSKVCRTFWFIEAASPCSSRALPSAVQ